jgi:hypothetical protein
MNPQTYEQQWHAILEKNVAPEWPIQPPEPNAAVGACFMILVAIGFLWSNWRNKA